MQASVQSDRPSNPALAADIDLGAVGRALWRKKFLVLGLTLFAAAVAFVAVNLITPRYKSEARVLVEARENIFFRPDAEKSLDRANTVDQEAVTSQVQLVLSRDLAREVIKKLKLGERPEFDPVLDGPSLLRTVLTLTGIVKNPLEMTPESLRSSSNPRIRSLLRKSRMRWPRLICAFSKRQSRNRLARPVHGS